MKCPRCSSDQLSVIDSRSDGEAIRRRRECDGCTFRFTTFERVELALPMVVKKDGRSETFDRDKVRAGLIRACEKTPVKIEDIDRTVDEIEGRIHELCAKEIPSRQVGEYVMDALKGLDKVAYVRFASVYREFRDVSQFVDTLESLKSSAKAGKARSASRGAQALRPEKEVSGADASRSDLKAERTSTPSQRHGVQGR